MWIITDCFKRMSLLPLPSHVAQWHSILLGYFSSGLAGWVGCRSSQTSVSRLFSLLSFLLSHFFCTDEEDQNCTFKSWAKHASKQCHHALSFVTCSAWELLALDLPLKGQLIHAKTSCKLHSWHWWMWESFWLYRLMQNSLLYSNHLRGKSKNEKDLRCMLQSDSYLGEKSVT